MVSKCLTNNIYTQIMFFQEEGSGWETKIWCVSQNTIQSSVEWLNFDYSEQTLVWADPIQSWQSSELPGCSRFGVICTQCCWCEGFFRAIAWKVMYPSFCLERHQVLEMNMLEWRKRILREVSADLCRMCN